MPHLEPTYLRYIYDGLVKGSIHPENAAELPEGLIGLYEEAFDERNSVVERQKLLQRFAIWALLKKEVSAAFVAEVLGETEEDILDFISTYSAWFNSPESGKYQLYHERLKVYLLQKLSEEEIHVLHEQLIAQLEQAIAAQKADEFEWYGLEHLHIHLSVASQLWQHYDRLNDYVNRENLWRRQIHVSKSYEWSQKTVQQGIKEGARRQCEMNTLRSAVNSVKLMIQEQNSAEDILSLLNEGDYLAALKRAQSWEGERQFKLYLLMLHDLTIGDSKHSEFRKEACKAILEAIDQTPEDHSVLDWTKFYPEQGIYLYDSELQKMNLNSFPVWKRGNYNLLDIIQQVENEISSLLNLVSFMKNSDAKVKANISIAKRLIGNGEDKKAQIIIQDTIHIASTIKRDFDQSIAYRDIAESIIQQGFYSEAIEIVGRIENKLQRTLALTSISLELHKKGEKKASESTLAESIKITLSLDEIKVNDIRLKSRALSKIAEVLFEKGQITESKSFVKDARQLASKIKSEYSISLAYREISKVLILQGEKVKAFEVASSIGDGLQKTLSFLEISRVLFDLGNKKLAKEASNIAYKSSLESGETRRIVSSLCEVSRLLLKQGDEKTSLRILNKANQIASSTNSIYDQSEAYEIISKSFLDRGMEDKSLQLSMKIAYLDNKSSSFSAIAKYFFQKKDISRSSLILVRSLFLPKQKSIFYDPYRDVSRFFLSKGKINEAFKLTRKIRSERQKALLMLEISIVLLELGEEEKSESAIEEGLLIASCMNDGLFKSITYREISGFLAQQNKIDKAKNIISEISDKIERTNALIVISKVLKERGDKAGSKMIMKESLKVATSINDLQLKSMSYQRIIKVLMEMKLYKEAINLAFDIPVLKEKAIAFYEIADMVEQKRLNGMYSSLIKESLKIGMEILDLQAKAIVLSGISTIVQKHDQRKDSGEIMNQSLLIASQINDEKHRNVAYMSISKCLFRNGSIQKAINTLELISSTKWRYETYQDLGKSMGYSEIKRVNQFVTLKENKNALLKGYSERILESTNDSEDIYPYLFNHPEQTDRISNILLYSAKMACFIEKEHNQEKLDMLSEVLDITDWRQISENLN